MSVNFEAVFRESGSFNAAFSDVVIVDAPIEHIKQNGVELPIEERTVDIDAYTKAQADAKIASFLPEESASGSVATFSDGANDVPFEEVIVDIDAVQNGTPAIETMQTPYVSRAIPSGFNRSRVQIVGGTVGWGQFANVVDGTGTVGGASYSISSGKLTISGTASSSANLNLSTLPLVNGHVYVLSASGQEMPVSANGIALIQIYETNTLITLSENSTKNYIIGKAGGTGNGTLRARVQTGTQYNEAYYPQVFDLTSFFNPTIADYAYSLEQQSAGSGIAWLKSFGFFTEDYYPYSATSLESVQTSGHVIKDAHGNVVRTYPTSDVILRGIVKKDANNNLYYDGDTYDSDGTVTRRFAEVDLGVFTWIYQNQRFYASPTGAKLHFDGVCSAYKHSSASGNLAQEDKSWQSNAGAGYSIWIRDDFYTDAATFKAAVSGVKLVYELTDSAQTTESADPFTSPFVLEEGGTESWTDAGTRDFAMPVGNVTDYMNVVPINGWAGMTLSHSGEDTSDPTTVSVSWQDEVETVYGGTLNVVTGLLTVTHVLVTKNTADMNNSETYPGWKPSGMAELVGEGINSVFTGLLNVGSKYGVNTAPDVDALWLPVGKYGLNQSAWKSMTMNIEIVIPLATPVIYQLAPVEVRTLLGVNNLWADTGDVSVKYRADIQLYVEELTQPTEDDMIANTNIASGKYFMVGNALYYSTASIAQGEAIVVGTNCTRVSIADALNALS